jgi:ankyrin repeat protein
MAEIPASEQEKIEIAQKEYFDSWDAYQNFQAQLQTDLSLQQFENAAGAIVIGDVATLKKLMEQNPALISTRSLRNHHATLLNYVGANGFEGYRQQTPANAVEITEVLLKAGAEVNACGDMYRGTSTLGLVATSVHPVKAGLQEPLMDILIRYGADVNHAVAPDYTEGMLILACIHNGRYEPIHYLARHGAKVDLEGACALGDLQTVAKLYNTTPEKRAIGLIWACCYGHRAVVNYVFEHGLSVNTEAYGTTPLHSAAYGGELALVRQLITLGASMEALNEHGGTVLGTTLWSLYNARKPDHLAIMELLIDSGAIITDGLLPYVEEVRKENAGL